MQNTFIFHNRSIIRKMPVGLFCLSLLCGSFILATGANADNAAKQDTLLTIAEAKGYQLVYDLDIGKAAKTIAYDIDNSAQITGSFDRVAYLLELSKAGQTQWIYVSMDAFTDSIGKIGVPTFESKAVFQQYVANLTVLSNVKEMTAGSGLLGNIEFWPNDYKQSNALNVTNASTSVFDFGDQMVARGNYGSMQVHNFVAKQTVFAFNHWVMGTGCDLGIGNAPGINTDWTFAKNGGDYETKRLRVLVRMAPGFRFIPLPPTGGLSASTPDAAPAAGVPATHINTAIVPARHNIGRTDVVMQRAKDAPGDYDIEFIGDSITQFWESNGKAVWQEVYGARKCINLGVGGDHTEHILWRFENGQLDGIKAKVAVVMIGTNNSNKNKDGTDTYTDSDILEGVTAVVNEIRRRQPDTKIILLGIFPRGKAFNPQRGRLLEINQALAKLGDGKNIFYLDFGSQLIEKDGSIAPDMMKDYLHPGEAGYKIWGAAIEPKLKELLAGK